MARSNRHYIVILSCLMFSLLGCSIFSPKKSSLTDYETARSKIDQPAVPNADGEFRMEGVSAEREGSNVDFLQSIGIRPKRRKNIQTARDHYAAGDKHFEEARELTGKERAAAFREAAKKYLLAAENWKSSGLEQDAMLMAAESHFFAEDYWRSETLYSKLVKEYPRNPYLDHIDSRRFEIGHYWMKYASVTKTPFVFVNLSDPKRPWNDTGGHGKRVLERLRIENPTGKISDDATMRLAMEQYERGRFQEAADTFSELRMTYPDSEHQFNAQFLELQSLLESYQGARYSSIPITDAQKRLEQIVRQFPNEAKDRREDLQKSYARIRYLMAERIWNQAKYRRDRKEYGSAKFHFNRILENYADTPFAEQAREGLEALQEKPDDPPQRFKALIWAFGESTDDRPWRNQKAK